MRVTDYAWVTLIVLALLYEGWTLINHTPNDTLSEAVWAVATKRPLIPFAAGFLMGHLFWQAAK